MMIIVGTVQYYSSCDTAHCDLSTFSDIIVLSVLLFSSSEEGGMNPVLHDSE